MWQTEKLISEDVNVQRSRHLFVLQNISRESLSVGLTLGDFKKTNSIVESMVYVSIYYALEKCLYSSSAVSSFF